MSTRILLSLLLLLSLPSLGRAGMTIVDENFDSYANNSAFENVWWADAGDGRTPTGGTAGILVPNLNAGLVPPNDDPPNIEGKGVNILTQINEYNGPNSHLLENLVPTDTESIRLSGDIYDDIVGNKRTTIGLRNDTIQRGFGVYGTNFVEMGFWNAATYDATDPANAPPATPVNDQPATDYAYRVALFGSVSGDLVRSPNWQYFQLNPVLDIDDTDLNTTEPTPDGLVSGVDIGPGWHRYETIITPTDITFTLDLFRDGVSNVSRDAEGNIEIGVGEPGVDASVTWEIVPNDDPVEPNPFNPFNSLRIGGTSGISGNNESVVDNIKLELVDVVTAIDDADFDDDGDIDGDDFLTWQRNAGRNDGLADNASGDADGDGNVLASDLAIWEMQYGSTPALASLAAVPEPTTAALALLSITSLLFASRRPHQN